MNENEFLENHWAFALLVSLAAAYSAAEAVGVHRNGGHRALMNPTVYSTVLGSILTLVMGSMLYILPEDMQMLSGTGTYITYWMNYYLFLLVLANIGLWSGYRSPFARAGARAIQQSRFLRRVVRTRFQVRLEPVVLLLGVSFACRLTLISLGVYGYSATDEALDQTASFIQYLTIGADAGKLALVVIALNHFFSPGASKNPILLIGMVVYEMFFGIISGFKSAVVMPLLIVAACAYWAQGRLPIKWICAAIFALILAYTLIEPFRILRHYIDDYKGTSITEIASAIFTPEAGSVLIENGAGELKVSIAGFFGTRNNTAVYAEGLRYADENASLPPESPKFLQDILLAPLLAVVPRALWPDKPEVTYGAWYRTAVLSGAEGTSVGMSPITYLYFAGGVLAVFLGFFAFGIYQSAMFHGFSSFGAGGTLIFLGMFSSLAGLDSVYYEYIITVIRMLPPLLIIQYIVFASEKKRYGSERTVRRETALAVGAPQAR